MKSLWYVTSDLVFDPGPPFQTIRKILFEPQSSSGRSLPCAPNTPAQSWICLKALQSQRRTEALVHVCGGLQGSTADSGSCYCVYVPMGVFLAGEGGGGRLEKKNTSFGINQ